LLIMSYDTLSLMQNDENVNIEQCMNPMWTILKVNYRALVYT